MIHLPRYVAVLRVQGQPHRAPCTLQRPTPGVIISYSQLPGVLSKSTKSKSTRRSRSGGPPWRTRRRSTGRSPRNLLSPPPAAGWLLPDLLGRGGGLSEAAQFSEKVFCQAGADGCGALDHVCVLRGEGRLEVIPSSQANPEGNQRGKLSTGHPKAKAACWRSITCTCMCIRLSSWVVMSLSWDCCHVVLFLPRSYSAAA
jgi:hypothetical protein